jgi:hypothetical protein
MRWVNDLAAVRDRRCCGRIDVVDRDAADPVRRPAVRWRIIADHRIGCVAGEDHVVALAADAERNGLPSEHVAVERLRLVRVGRRELVPHELAWELSPRFSHDPDSFRCLVFRGESMLHAMPCCDWPDLRLVGVGAPSEA